MNEKRWDEICQKVKFGDPLKDIDRDEMELFQYCSQLRTRVDALEALYKTVTDALPVIRYFENTLASSLSSDSRSHDQDRQPRAQLNAVMDAQRALTEKLSQNDAANIIYRASKNGGWHKCS